MNYTIDIEGLKRDLPLCKVADNFYIGAFIMYGDVECTKHCAAKLLEKAPEFDVMLTGASKGIPLAYEMSSQSGKEYVVALKSKKVYMENPVSVSVNSITTFQTQTLWIGETDVEKIKGKRTLIVDDVVSTGNSMEALEALVTTAGGEIVGKMTALAEGDAMDRPDIVSLQKLPVFNEDGTIKE